ncbi:DNA primase [Ferrimonas sediminum]|uniref:DNA primase n=1 Tax=Ferrimonas sediminum TaxID=718193 RepID=A0A1G8MFY4_9GAMM|nr:DNA primase [Ferrimonas sediminum]SDI66782.1 DNA primase [Ferrimonas sediminum]
MAGRIPRDFIDQLLARVDIVDLIDARVKLKKSGKNHSACCPFHNEKSPSFTVSQDKQFYHCFGCGAHGNALDFVMEYDRLEFVDAIEDLAAMMGMEIPREQGSHRSNAAQAPKLTSHYELMDWAAKFFQLQLRKHPSRQAVIDYIKQRGLDGDTVKRFGIGFAPDGWDNLQSQHKHNPSGLATLTECGMLIAKEGGGRSYDRFRDRLMFPIRDRRGRVVAFGGRVLGDGTPKYLNSPETPIFHKGRELYGLYELKQHQRNPQRILVVEGYMDVVALAQHGIPYAVASLGTSTTSDQMQLLLRTSSQIICCYDGDNAGREAAWRAMETALPHLRDGVQLKFMFLPDGEDPDSLVRQQGQQAFEALVDDATPLSDYLFTTMLKQADLSSQEGKSKLATNMVPLLNQIPEGLLKESLFSQLERSLGWGARSLRTQSTPAVSQPKGVQGRGTPVRRAIALLQQHPQLGYQLPAQEELAHLELAGLPLLREMLELCRPEPLTTGQLMERFRGRPEYGALSKLLGWKLEIEDESLFEQEFTDCLLWLNQRFFEQMSEQLQRKARDGSITTEELRQLQEMNLLLQGLKGSRKASD